MRKMHIKIIEGKECVSTKELKEWARSILDSPVEFFMLSTMSNANPKELRERLEFLATLDTMDISKLSPSA
jgi:predicted dinucleotide-utilizing enzyme